VPHAFLWNGFCSGILPSSLYVFRKSTLSSHQVHLAILPYSLCCFANSTFAILQTPHCQILNSALPGSPQHSQVANRDIAILLFG
jgi:hypothetical protein